jgi:hypothetical protein
MKTRNIKFNIVGIIGLLMVIATLAVVIVSCKKEDNTEKNSVNLNSSSLKSGDASYVFPVNANMYGKSYAEWGEAFFNWQVSFDCAHYPYDDATGALQNQNQSGPVFFLGGAHLKPAPLTTNREVTVPANVSLFIPLIYYYSNTCAAAPVGDIVGDATGFTNVMDQLTLTIDGVSINASNYKTITPVFNYTANADLTNCTGDLCFDGTQHEVVLGGYWVILKKLSVGDHVIHTTGGASAVFPVLKDVVWTIHQQ